MPPTHTSTSSTALTILRGSIVLALSASYFAYVFQISHGTWRTTGLGDWIDPYFINYLLEHWHHSLWHFSDPSSPPMYFPARGTLGYSHGLILYVPFYLAVRPFLNPFQAYTATVLLVLETGSLSLYLIFRKFLKLGFIEALLLSAFFVSSQNVINEKTGVWTQRASMFLAPPILLLALVAAHMPKGRPRLMLASLSGLLTILLFTQDFYTGQLEMLVATLLFAGVLILATGSFGRLVIDARNTAAWTVRHYNGPARTRLPSVWWLVVACLSMASAVAIWTHPIPRTTIGSWKFTANNPSRSLIVAFLTGGWFIWRRTNWTLAAAALSSVVFKSAASAKIASYWKRSGAYTLAFASGAVVGCAVFFWIYLAAHREHPLFPEDQLMHSMTALDWAHVDVMKALGTYDSLRPFELVFVVAMLAWVPWFGVSKNIRLYGLWIVLVSILVLAIPLKFNDFSIWKTVFAPIPGLSVIRDPKRIIEAYELAVVLLTAWFLATLPRKSVLRIVIGGLMLVLMVTGWNRGVFDFKRPTNVYNRWVQAPIDVNASCRSFFIQGASEKYMSRSDHMWSLYNIDAMFIALNYDIPTLNGYSAWAPEGWRLSNPQEADYPTRVSEWIQKNHLTHVCALDIDKRSMTPYQAAAVPD